MKWFNIQLVNSFIHDWNIECETVHMQAILEGSAQLGYRV